MNKPQKHYAKGKKTDTKDHMLYNSIFKMCPKQATLYWLGLGLAA